MHFISFTSNAALDFAWEDCCFDFVLSNCLIIKLCTFYNSGCALKMFLYIALIWQRRAANKFSKLIGKKLVSLTAIPLIHAKGKKYQR